MKKIIGIALLMSLAVLLISFTLSKNAGEPSGAPWGNSAMQSIPARTIIYIIPDKGPHAAAYLEYVQRLGNRQRFYAIQTLPASASDTLSVNSPIYVLGTPASNRYLSAFADDLPIRFAKNSFAINGARYDHDTDVAVLSLPHPRDNNQNLTIISGNQDQGILDFLQQNGRRLRRYGDFTVLRNQQVAAYGFFENSGSSKPGVRSEVHFLNGKKRIFESATFRIDYLGTPPDQQALQRFIEQQAQAVHRQMHQLAFKDSATILPISLTLYDTAERKTIATGDSRLSSWQPGDGNIHIVFNSALRGNDFTAIAEFLCWQWAGEIPNENVRQAAGILFSQQWGREGYPVLAGRFFHNGFFVPFHQLFTNNHIEEASPYLIGAQLATFLQFVLFHDGASSLQAVLRNTPATLTLTEIDKRFSPDLQKIWQRWCGNMLQDSQPEKIATDGAFQKGFCFAHEGYSVYNGYMGSTSEASLARLDEIGANAISITPFGYPRSIREPAPMRRSFGTGSENDESVIVSGHFAREHGMQIMLKPHLWAGRSWPGDIKMEDPADWPGFFRHYEQWITHYAILAQMCQFEHLVIGVEMVQATVGHEPEWRGLIQRLRKVYGGQLIYAANWGEEFEKVTFWDALDAIGVNCYYPLSKSETPQPGDLQQGARKNMRLIESVAKKYDKPVIITEIGFASRPAPWILPYVDGRDQPVELDGQKRSYEAIIAAFRDQPWLHGIYWWKWPSDLREGGPQHSGFTPNGKPAEEVIAEWYLQ